MDAARAAAPPETTDAEWNALLFDIYQRSLEESDAALPDTVRGLPYLITLRQVAGGFDSLMFLTFLPYSEVLPEMADALERHGMPAEAAMLRTPMASFPDWTARLDENGWDWPRPGEAGAAIEVAQAELIEAAPGIAAKVEALITSDPAVAAEYEARRLAAGADTRVAYLARHLADTCLAAWWWTPDEADAAFAAIAQPQADILLLDAFRAESFNGSKRYFFERSGTMAPNLVEALERAGLTEHAAAMQKGINLFPGAYPRDTDVRRTMLEGLTEAETAALDALEVWAKDGKILEAMIRIAEESGLMPR